MLATDWDLAGPDHFFRASTADPRLDSSTPMHLNMICGLGNSGPASIPNFNRLFTRQNGSNLPHSKDLGFRCLSLSKEASSRIKEPELDPSPSLKMN